MKVRNDFVTNSSSSSFIISKKNLDDDQLEAIKKHSILARKMGFYHYEEEWHIEENDDFITCYTWMDNFDMLSFLENIDVNKRVVCWGEYPFNIDAYGDCTENMEENTVTWRDLLHENKE